MAGSYATMASSLGMRLLVSAQVPITTLTPTVMDLGTYIDVTPYEGILVVVISNKVGGGSPETGTNIFLTALTDSQSNGATAVAMVDRNGAALTNSIGGTAAVSRAMSMQLRTRGMKQYFSPGLAVATAQVTASIAVYGIGPRDTVETSATWLDEAGASNAGNVFS